MFSSLPGAILWLALLGSLGANAETLKTPLGFDQNAIPYNFQSQRGVPISMTVSNPPGSDGRMTNYNQSTGAIGLPILERAIASLECRLEQVVRLGDHDFLVGRVVSVAGPDDSAGPLLYLRRRYGRIEQATGSPLEGNADH